MFILPAERLPVDIGFDRLALSKGNGDNMTRHRRHRAGEIWAFAGAGLFISIAAGTLVADYAVGPIDPVARSSNWTAPPRALARSDVDTLTYTEVPRSTWGDPLYEFGVAPDQTGAKIVKDNWLDDLKRLEARWRQEDQARDIQAAMAPGVSRDVIAGQDTALDPEATPTELVAPEINAPDEQPAIQSIDPASAPPTS